MKRGAEAEMVPEAEFRSYYGRPILKIPRWKAPHLPAYLYLGGLSGASAVMGAAAAVTGRRALARAGRVTAAAAAMGGTGFLVAELGRPERFLHMLRVAKPTSPMSMGSWLLAAHSALAGAAAGSDLTGVAPGLGATAGAASALTGPLLATYSAVLLADTAVPAWHEAYRELPFLFAGSALASAGAAGLAATALSQGADRGPAARMAVLGAALELAAAVQLERGMGLTAETYQQGEAGQMMRAARWLTPAGAVAALAARRSRAAALAAAGLLTAGAVATRVGVFKAGPASAADPKYVIASQRATTSRNWRRFPPAPAGAGGGGQSSR